MLSVPLESDRAFVSNYQTLGYLKGERLALLHPKRRSEVFRVDGAGNVVASVRDPAMVREAISFYSMASYVFRRGLYRDEEQTTPVHRAGLVKVRHGG